MEFSRVVDSAGALTHQERQELLDELEDLERSIPPVALCIYITDDGHAEEFRTHAHWILNHAHIHHPSFGRREKHKAIEDAELNLRFARDAAENGEQLAVPAPARKGWLSRIRSYLRDALHPHLPPPVQQQWMLILVLDVQLERACFSWGYQLDPYINPDRINGCILDAKFHFRERAMLTGLKKVMKKATRQIATSTRRVNAQLRYSGRLKVLGALAASACLLGPSPCSAAPAVLADDDVAEEVAPAAPVTGDAPAEGGSVAPVAAAAEGAAETTPEGAAAGAAPVLPSPAPEPGAAASYAAPPRWSDEDYRHLMDGELVDGYTLLLQPAEGAKVPRRFRTPSSSQENDKKVPARYSEAYRQPSAAGLSDPQGLLSVEDRRDVEHVLRELNANSRFRIYVALYRAGQQLPPELAVHMLAHQTARPLEYAALLLFPLGDSQQLDLGYELVEPSDEDRHAWLQRVRSAAAPEGDGVEALLPAIREVHAVLEPLSSSFKANVPDKVEKLPEIEIELRPDDGEKKVPVKDIIGAYFKDSANHPLIFTVATLLALIAIAVFVFFFRRRTGTLLESRPDVRLSSPYGAGVSRYVRYLEGKESPKESRIY